MEEVVATLLPGEQQLMVDTTITVEEEAAITVEEEETPKIMLSIGKTGASWVKFS